MMIKRDIVFWRGGAARDSIVFAFIDTGQQIVSSDFRRFALAVEDVLKPPPPVAC